MKRRRFITIIGAATAVAVGGCRVARMAPRSRWRGVLFNADVDLSIHDLPEEEADALTDRCIAEMQRLEQLFSLYVPESALCELNREGVLRDPPAEFVRLVDEALAMAEKTGGVFDPTVQPYWLWLREAVESGREWRVEEQRRHLGLVDFRKVHSSAEEIRYGASGMGMTLNGIAQGWITDRVCALLREAGARHCLVNLGEFSAIGGQASGKDWRVGIRGREDSVVTLRDEALAVSSGAGYFFGTGAGKNHLIDPRSGDCSEDERIVAVTAADATTADALSTACAVLGDEEAERLVRGMDGARVEIYRA